MRFPSALLVVCSSLLVTSCSDPLPIANDASDEGTTDASLDAVDEPRDAAEDHARDAVTDVALDRTTTDVTTDDATDETVDAAIDVTTDTTTDVSMDTAADVAADLATDTPTDVARDVATDTPTDVARDVAMDTTPDVARDVAMDTTPDVARDVAMDTTPDVARDVALDLTTDSPADAARDIAADTAMDATADSTTDVARDAITDAASDVATDTPTDVAIDAPAVAAPRPIAPLSGAHAPTRRPSLRWQLATGSDGARVTLCRDRALTLSCTSFDATGTSGAPSSDLAPGVWFWSLRGLRGGIAGVTPGPVWRVSIASATLAGARPWGADPDVNGDGIAEVFAAARSDALYVYVGGVSGPSVPPVTLSAPFDATGFARSFDFVGDVNGDGYGDVAVGASGSDNFYVFRGGPTGLSGAAPWSVTGARGSGFGAAVSPAGDVNGDGYDDLVVGYSSAGSLVFVPGGAAGLGAPVRLVGASYRGGSGVGDVNGDGYADVQSGADLFLGGATGLDLSRVRAGAGGISAGDVNGDGLGDVVWGSAVRLGSTTLTGSVVALPFGTSGHVGQFSGDFNRDGYSDVVWLGRFGAAVVPGSSSGPTSAVVYNGPGFGAMGGWATQGGGDVDGDGYEDLIDLDDNVVLVLRGSATGIAATTTWTFDVTPVFGLPTGAMPYPAGDVNHDGRDDLAIGTWDGQLSLHHGSATGPSATAAARATYLRRAGSTTQHLIPHGGGDLNGDTFGDLVLEANEGALAPFAALTYGTATGLNLTPVWLPRPATVGRSVVIAGDLNGDRIADAALAAGSSLNVIYGRAGAVDPAGTSIAVPAAEVDAAGDVNHDGYADLLVQPTPTATAVIYPGSASGLRATALSTLATAGVATPIGDVNADGYADIAVTSAAGVSVYYGGPSGTGPSEALRYPGALSVIALGDVDRDGDADIATTGFEIYYSYPVSLHRGGPSGVEASTWRVWYAPAGATIASGPRGSGDFDGDGATDIAWLRDNQVFTNRLGSFASVTQSLPTASGVIVYNLIR